MAGVQSISLTTPTDYTAEQQSIERQRKMAELLQQQSMQPLDTNQTAGGYVIPVSPLQGLAKMLQAYGGAQGQRMADQKQRDLLLQQRDQNAAEARQFMDAYRGVPSQAPATPNDDEGNANPMVAGTAPNKDLAMQLAMSSQNPMVQGMGGQLITQEMQSQRMADALKTAGLMPGSTTTPQQALSQGGGPTNAAASQIGQPTGQVPNGVSPQAWALAIAQGDLPGITKMVQEGYAEGNKPVINRGFGVGRMVNGQYVPDQASLDQALVLERGKQGITAPFEPPVTIDLSGGQKAQLSRPEYAAFQKTGNLPARYTGNLPTNSSGEISAIPANEVAAAKAAGVNVNAPSSTSQNGGLGVPGLTQSQPDQIRQEGQKAANTEAGKQFIEKQAKNFEMLRDVPATIQNMNRAKQLAGSQASQFMGPFGESKLAITKFMRANVPGMGNISTEGVTNAEELKSALFNQVMDNLKKMDASPSQYQQQVMQEAFGTLRTDPQSLPKILDVFSDILKNRVAIHNQTVKSAEERGTTFPYDISVKMPQSGGGVPADIQQLINQYKVGNGRP